MFPADMKHRIVCALQWNDVNRIVIKNIFCFFFFLQRTRIVTGQFWSKFCHCGQWQNFDKIFFSLFIKNIVVHDTSLICLDSGQLLFSVTREVTSFKHLYLMPCIVQHIDVWCKVRWKMFHNYFWLHSGIVYSSLIVNCYEALVLVPTRVVTVSSIKPQWMRCQ